MSKMNEFTINDLSSQPRRSFQAKVIWAHQHMNAFRLAISRFGLSNPCVVVHDFDPKGSKHTWRVSGKPDTPPQELSLRLGDVFYNLRGVLDHLAWELVIANGATPSRKTAFPICECPNDFVSKGVQRRMDGMSTPMRTRIEELQPYNGVSTHCPNYHLGLLDSLGNVEKHRHFNLIAASVDLAAFSVDDSLLGHSFIHEGPVEDGTILAVAEGPMDVKFIAAFGVAFGQGGIAPGELVSELILRIELAVQNVIFELAHFALQP
jgi:hypothetical protein